VVAAQSGVTGRSKLALARGLSALDSHSQDILIVLGLLALFGFVHRRVEVVEFGGDAVEKWQFVRQWWFHFDWAHADLDHHCGRMGVNGVAWLAQALFGRGWKAYYVAPFFMAMLQLPFVYLIGKRVMNRLAGVLGVLLITYLATVHRSTSQLLPDGFGGTYAIISTYFYLRFAESAQKNPKVLPVGMAIGAFGAYLAKETCVFFFPGMVIALWLVRRNWRDVAAFLGLLFAGLLLETALYASFTKYSSRYAVVRSVHGADGIWQQVKFVELFDRFAHLHDGWKYLLFFSLASGLWLLVLNGHARAAGQALAIIGFSQVFFLTFMVRGFNPVELWESFEPRYIEPFTPFAALITGAFLAHVLATLWNQGAWWKGAAQYGPTQQRFVALWALGSLLLVASAGRALTVVDAKPSGVAQGEELARMTTNTYERGLPVAEHRRGKTRMLELLYDVYLDDRLLARAGRLPNLPEATSYERGFTYFVKSPTSYGPGKFSQLLTAGCVLEASRVRREYQLSSWDPLPAKCDNLLRGAPQQ